MSGTIALQGKQHLCFIFSFLFLGLFSGIGQPLIRKEDNVVKFVHICSYFMVNKYFVSDMFRATFPSRLFAENQFCEVIFEIYC